MRVWPALAVFTLSLFLLCEITPRRLEAQEVEDALGEEAGVSEASFVVDRLERLEGRPMDINSASASELAELPWISPLLAQRIVSLREKVGRFRSLVELSVIPGVDYQFLQALSSYLAVTSKGIPFWIPLEVRVRLVGEKETRTAKDLRFYTRFTSRPSQHIELCYLAEKDEGESSAGDFQAGYATLRRESVLSSFSVGDLSAEFAQGLVLWAPQGFFRGYETVSQTDRSGSGVKGYRSSVENGALRGAHVQLARHGVFLDALFSRSRLDAFLNDDGTARRLGESGLHREDWEVAGKDALSEELFALRLAGEYSGSLFLEGTFYTAGYEPALSGGDASDSYYFSGDRTSVGGLGGRWSFGRASLFGEGALMEGGSKAFLLGWVCVVNDVEVASVFRSYDSDFYNLRASSFSGGDPWNERGVYLGAQARVGRYKLRAYIDGVQHPGPTLRESFPTSGYETAGSVEQQFGSGITVRVRGKLSRREVSEADPSDEYGRVSSLSTRETVHTDVSWNPSARLKSRLRFSTVRAGKGEKGSLSFVDFNYRTRNLVTLKGRVIYFNTSSYESRVYEYEGDLPGRVTLMPLWDEGVRWYIILAAAGKKLKAAAKVSQTHRTGETVDTELGFQLDFAF
ncbi:MAG: helix-hairpin-helix domain-containing protein [Candidatus Eiseniibacteriota bacterium]|nr:MAG: helix-hairpin-helix domain-containing protein [Candidatus Eisenbacteria bacterium]